MKNRFRLVQRGSRGKKFYAFDTVTNTRSSLNTRDEQEAVRLLNAKNEAANNTSLNLQLARVYLQQSDPKAAERTWQDVIDEYIARSPKPSTRERKVRAAESRCYDSLRNRKLLETTSDQISTLVRSKGAFANHFVRCLHNLALGLGWLPWPIVPSKLWPKAKPTEKRGITFEEHQKIVAAEQNAERRLFYELLWEIGAAQSDAANLKAENIDWRTMTLSFQRMKTGEWCCLSFGPRLEALLRSLPASGFLFPKQAELGSTSRAAEFSRRCRVLGIKGISLHSYRHAWAARAKQFGMPERFAMEALGHNSRAVHKYYSQGARAKVPSLEEYEAKVIPMPQSKVG